MSAEFVDVKGLLTSFAAFWYRSYSPYDALNITDKHPWTVETEVPVSLFLEPDLLDGLKGPQPELTSFLLEISWREGGQWEPINALLNLILRSPELAQALEKLIKKLKRQRRKELIKFITALGSDDNIRLIKWLIQNNPANFNHFISTGFFNDQFFIILKSLINNNDELLDYFLFLLNKAPQIIRMLLSQTASIDIKTLLERIRQTLENTPWLSDLVCELPTMGAVLLVHHMHYDWGLPDDDTDAPHLTQLHKLFVSYIHAWMAQYGQRDLDIDSNALATTFLHLFLHNPQTMTALFAEIYHKPEWYIRGILLKLSQLEGSNPGKYSKYMITRLFELLGEPTVLELLERMSDQLSTAQLYVLLTRNNQELRQWLLRPVNINHALLGIIVFYGGIIPRTPSPVTPAQAALTEALVTAMKSPSKPIYLGSELTAMAEHLASLLIALFPQLGTKADKNGVDSELDDLFDSGQLDVETLAPQVQALLSQSSRGSISQEELTGLIRYLEHFLLTPPKADQEKH